MPRTHPARAARGRRRRRRTRRSCRRRASLLRLADADAVPGSFGCRQRRAAQLRAMGKRRNAISSACAGQSGPRSMAARPAVRPARRPVRASARAAIRSSSARPRRPARAPARRATGPPRGARRSGALRPASRPRQQHRPPLASPRGPREHDSGMMLETATGRSARDPLAGVAREQRLVQRRRRGISPMPAGSSSEVRVRSTSPRPSTRTTSSTPCASRT